MSSSPKDLSYLFNCETDSDFIISCYETLLNRTIDPHELRYAIQMFKDGLSRGGFIYWVSRSSEFNQRFNIKDIKKYRMECYSYKIGERAKRALKLDKKVPVKLDLLPVQNMISTNLAISKLDMTMETEFSALSTGQISQIKTYIPDTSDTVPYITAGYLAQDIINPSMVSQTYVPFEFDVNHIFEKNNFFITSPGTIYQLLTTNSLEKFARKTQDYFVFTMPVLPAVYNSLSVVWDTQWDNYEVRASGSYERWMRGNTKKAGIHIINNSDNEKHVTIAFTLSSLDIGSSVILEYAGQKNVLVFHNTLCPVSINLWLNTGNNDITFTYFGSKITPPGDWSRAVKFSVIDFNIKELSASSAAHCRKAAYDLCEAELGSGYYPFILTDPFIRSQLHRNGFFQIEAYRIFSTYAVQKCAVTRYYHSNDERSLNCYYIFQDEVGIDNTENFSSLMIYIAQRTAPFHAAPFEFIKSVNG
ncbi:MAG: DUF4214 domain-containing protein [Clostridiaceae bacterium]|nr:DUF4214 domain-containing protein [Clostridiaceae bacterium]